MAESGPIEGRTYIFSFEEMEREYILQDLKAKNWKVEGTNSAASVLQMNPNTLRSRMQKLGIHWRQKGAET